MCTLSAFPHFTPREHLRVFSNRNCYEYHGVELRRRHIPMRTILASLLILSAPALAQQNSSPARPDFLDPTAAQSWQLQPLSSTPEQQLQLALRWAEVPVGVEVQSFKKEGSALPVQPRSTVGQGSH
jgi:hypothetical protein